MPLLDQIKETLGVSDSQQTYRYHCKECETEFESSEVSTSRVECPDCGAGGSLSITSL